MDDSDDEGRYPSKQYSVNRQAIHNFSSSSSKPPKRNPHFYTNYQNDDVFDDEDDDGDDDNDDEEEFDQEDEKPQGFNDTQSGYFYSHNDESKRHPKKRKLGELVSNYEFGARPGGNHVGSSRGSWSEEESFVLLEVWGERFMELGRRSLRGEDWVEVAEKVSEMGRVERDVMECRSQFDVMKKRYKKEQAKMEQIGGGFVSKWVFFKKMDVLLNLRMRGHCGLGCGVDSGEYVFMNPRVYLDRSNVLDEMRDSPAESDEDNEEEEGMGGEEDNGQSAKLLAESIQKFGDIYEKMEASKRKQMMELEIMRRDFQRDLEMQKKEILERAQDEIAKLREMDDDDDDSSEDDDDDDDDDGSTENPRG